MTKKPERRPSEARKQPIQARSKVTVEAIVTAAAQVLVARGYDKTTTNHVAARAGVSIGTLYQYFPNKEALIEALARAHADELLSKVDAAMERCRGLPIDQAVIELIRAGLEAHAVNPALHKVLVEQVPRIGGLASSLDIGTDIRRRIEAYLIASGAEHDPSTAQLTAFILETCIEALTHRAVVEQPDWLQSDRLERETAVLLRAYMNAPERQRGRR